MRHISAAFFLLLALAARPTFAQANQQSEVFRLYSDICLHEESGDILGTRIVLLRFAEESFVYFQTAEGWVTDPVSAKANLSAGRLTFSVLRNGKLRHFNGTISDKEITGSFDGRAISPRGGVALRLKRQPNMVQGYPLC